MLTSADGSDAFGLSVPVEYPAAEGLSDIPALLFTQRFRRSDDTAQRAAAIAYTRAHNPTAEKSDRRRIGLKHHRIESGQCIQVLSRARFRQMVRRKHKHVLGAVEPPIGCCALFCRDDHVAPYPCPPLPPPKTGPGELSPDEGVFPVNAG